MEHLSLAKRRSRQKTAAPAARERFLLFRVGDEVYGMGLQGLQAVVQPDDITPLPQFQDLSALVHRGLKLPVLRMRALFDLPQGGGTATAKVLLTRGPGRSIGLLVDEVLGMIEVEPARIGPLPILATLLDPTYFRGVFSHQDRIVLLVNEDGLARFDEVAEFYASGS